MSVNSDTSESYEEQKFNKRFTSVEKLFLFEIHSNKSIMDHESTHLEIATMMQEAIHKILKYIDLNEDDFD